MTMPNPQPVDDRNPADVEEDSASEQLVLTSPDAADSPRDFGLWAGVLFLFALTIYSPAMRGEFLWDDDRHVSQNVNLRSADGLKNIWTKIGMQNGGTPQYYPLTHTTYWIEYQLFGNSAGPDALSSLPFHVTNILLHAGAAVLLWFTLRRLRVPGAWLCAAIFAVHPVHAESVAWISERKNVLSAMFMLAAILAYLKFERIGDEDRIGSSIAKDEPRDFGGVYSLALGLFIAALLSKTVAVSTPAVILLLFWWKRGRLGLREVLPLVPFFIIGIAAAVLTSYIERQYVIGLHHAAGDWDLSPVQRILIAGRAVWFYAMKLVLPMNLTFIYPRWDTAVQAWQWLFVLATIAMTAALWAMRTRIGRAPLVAWLIYVGVLVPALGFFDVYPMRYSFVADHFQYHASPALIALLVGGAVVGFRRLNRRSDVAPAATGDVPEQSPMPYVASAIVLMLLGVFTWRQSFIYADAVTLWRDTIAKNPSAWMARHNLGYELTDLAEAYGAIGDEPSQQNAKELLEQAVDNLSKAVALRPTHDVALLHWGRALLAQGKDAEATQKFEEALKVNPNNVEAMTNRGFMLEKAGKRDEAIAAYREALATCEQGPAAGHARCGQIARMLGAALEASGDKDGALAAYTRAVRFAPGNVQTRYDYGTLLALRAGEATGDERRKRQVEAADQFLEIIRRDPQHQDARISLAMLLVDVGNLPRAQFELIGAARIDPNAPRLMEAAKVYDAEMARYEASTQPSTQSTTAQSTTAQSTTAPASTRPTPDANLAATTTTSPAPTTTRPALP